MDSKVGLLNKFGCRQERVAEINEKLTLNFYNSIDELDFYIGEILPQDLYWNDSYHRLVETLEVFDAEPYYAILKNDNNIIGIFYFQLKDFKLSESLRVNSTTIKQKIAKRSFDLVKFKCLVCGNLLLTGKYGIETRNLNPQQTFKQLEFVIDGMISHLERESNLKIGTVLVKDFYADQVNNIDMDGYTKFKVQPNMVFDILPSWMKFEEYLSALKSKYQKRYRRARRKFAGLTSRELSLEEIKHHQKKLYQLYLNVSNNASFNLFVLDEDYFYKLKKSFGQKLSLQAYFLEDEIVGFYTVVKNYNHLDAHFLGYDMDANREHQLYLNMLYDMVDYGITEKMTKVIMSRTALEIKSSIGAKPKEMYCFFKHNNLLINKVTPKLLSYYKPDGAWTPRNPYS